MGLIMNHKKSSGLPTNGLIAYYPFDGNTNDYSGNNRHLIMPKTEADLVLFLMVITENLFQVKAYGLKAVIMPMLKPL